MKKLFTLFFALVVSSMMTVQAQSTMRVTKTDGTVVNIKVADIDEITFPGDDEAEVSFMYYNRFWLHPEQWVQLVTTIMRDGEEVYAFVEWKSTDESVATVDNTGKVTGVGDGKCQILAVTEYGQGQFEIDVVTEPQIDLNVTNIQNRDCRYTITPKDPATKYYYNLRIQSGSYSVDDFDQYGSEEQNMLHFARDWWSFVASMYGIEWKDYMNDTLNEGVVSEGAEATQSDGLIPGQQYCLYAFGLDEEGELTTPIEVTKFTTTKPEMTDMTFECEFNEIKSDDATFTITPSDQTQPYFVNVQRASYVEWFIENEKLDEMVTSLTGSITPGQYPEAYNTGTATRKMTDFLGTVRSNNDYYVIVFGWDDGQTTDVQVFKFHTK